MEAGRQNADICLQVTIHQKFYTMEKGQLTMRIIITKNYEELSEMAANMILAQVILKPDSVLGLATGGSQ